MSGLRNCGAPLRYVMVPKTNAVVPLGGRKEKIERLAERLGEDAYSAEVIPAGDSGERRPSLGVGMVGSRAGA